MPRDGPNGRCQRAQAIKRRRQIWDALHPDEIQVEKVFPPESATGYKQPPPQEKGFAASTAAAAGMTKQAINQHLARAEALGDDLDEITGTSLDKGVELDALKDMPEEDRRDLIRRAKDGENVTARGEEDRERNLRLVRQAIADMARLAKFSSPAEVASIAASIGIGAEEAAIAKAIAGAL